MSSRIFVTRTVIMASGKSKTSFCIDSLLAQDKVPSVESPTPASHPSHHQQLIISSYGDSIRFRSNLFGGLHHHGYPVPLGVDLTGKNQSVDAQQSTDVDKETTDGRQSSNSSNKEDGASTTANADGQQVQSSVSCWTPMGRMVYGPVTTSGLTVPTSSILSSSSSSTAVSQANLSSYPGPLFTSPAAALHAAAAAAAAAVAASSPTAHQFHSAHLEWLARAGVLYHRFGGDLSGESRL